MPRTIVYRAGGFTNCGIGYTRFSQEELAEMKDRAMTESEAIKFLKERIELINSDYPDVVDYKNALECAIRALEEVQQYRKHGVTVESALNNMCDLAAAENLIEEYREIGTLEECRAAMEKQTAKKAITYRGTNRADCPACGATVRGIGAPFGNWCSKCGQRLDWEDEE